MIAKFNPTGTHIHKGFLKVRIDLYPEIGDKTYEIHHVQVPDPKSSLSKIWQTNPCLCHFIKVEAGTTLSGLTDYVRSILDKNTVLELDDLLSKVNIDHTRLSQVMKSKCGTGGKASHVPIDLNSRLSSLEAKVG